MYYCHKFEVALQYGGPEEGGWYFNSGEPTGQRIGPFAYEDDAFEKCRELNDIEHKRSEEQQYGYTSVLAHRSEHFEWDVSDEEKAKPFPEYRPHYE